MSIEEFTSNLRFLISKNKLHEVIDLLLDYLSEKDPGLYSEILMISNQFQDYNKRTRMNLPVIKEDYNKIVHSVILVTNLIEQKETDINQGIEDRITNAVTITKNELKKKKILKYGIGLSLGASVSALTIFFIGFSTAAVLFSIILVMVMFLVMDKMN